MRDVSADRTLSPTLDSATGGDSSLPLNWILGGDGGSPITNVEYSTGISQPTIDDNSPFTWQRRSNKKVNVYFRTLAE